MKVLILSVSVGSGHMRAAMALKKAADLAAPGMEIRILDTFSYASPLIEKLIMGSYIEIIRIVPVVYGYLYRQSEHGKPLSGRGKLEFNKLLSLLAAPKLVDYIKSYKPDAILCTHPFPLGIVAYIKKISQFKGSIIAIITDFTVHPFWIFPEVDRYIIATEKLGMQCTSYGVMPGQVVATGIPIDPVFGGVYNKPNIKKQLGLNPNLPAILVVGGGMGMGSLLSSIMALGNMNGYQIIAVAGSNRKLHDKLVNLASKISCGIKIHGFVDNMHEMMAASDFIIGKSGGLTCAEAMAMGLPMIIYDPLPGQEERNAEFLIAVGAGLRVRTKMLAKTIKELYIDYKRVDEMANSALSIGKPNAAYEAVKLINKHVNKLV